VSDAAQPFDSGRPRPIVTVLDTLRRQIDHEAFDAAVFSLDAVAADLGYGDVRPLPGAIAWIDRLRRDDKRIAVAAAVERAEAALELAGIADRIDVVVTGSHAAARLARGVARGEATPDRLRRAGAVTVVADLQELLGSSG
jgi:beta-phosphoglucomutase-like phosphatase (HAD superfamily)